MCIQVEVKVVTSSARINCRSPSLLLINATSLAKKMDELIVTVSSTFADIVVVTEAWQIVPEVSTMQDYQLYHHLRSGRKGGSGRFLPLYPQPLTPPSRYSSRCRGPVAQLLTAHIIDNADALRVRYPAAKLVICGDFNRIHINDILHQLHLTQVVDFPTHQQAILDLILTDLGQQY
ncbi:hypothetical protein O3P69_011860 [Scylla paramamosain]|uniref:Endonuclease/exonuclease/phosphatase domain-containing protein n=1 Tax=Scylla paramamosain TaxID=85552 RepID=A0AAW0SA14_SCYPA